MGKFRAKRSYEFEDPNCAESAYEICSDGKDNDGNHLADCEGSKEYLPEVSCCPMASRQGPNGLICVLEASVIDPDEGICRHDRSGNGYSIEHLPRACADRAIELEYVDIIVENH